jgi:hypothetical protein
VKTIAVESTEFINLDMHLDNMEIREALEWKEYGCLNDGVIVWCCPVCGTTWLQEEEGYFTTGSCEHLRFKLHDSSLLNGFDFFGEWDIDGFVELVEQFCTEDEEGDIFEVLGRIQHLDVDEAVYYVWHDDPLYHPWIIWGYKER